MCKSYEIQNADLRRILGISTLSTESFKTEKLKVVALTEKQVSKSYAISTSSLQKHRMNRTGPPYVRLGRRCFYLVEDLDAYFKQHRIDPSQ